MVLFIIVYCLYVVYRSVEAMHMLQQNLYNENNRYLKWVISNYRKAFSLLDFLPIILFSLIYFVNDNHIIDLVLIASMFIYLFGIVNEYRKNKDNQNKIPLKATGRIKRLFVTGDRIQIDDIIGDVMSVSTFDFDVLEISNDTHGQSTGIMITLPNSYVFTRNIKNYTKGFKYVWNELTMKVPVKCNLVNNKRELYKIVNNIENVKYIVDKMKVQSNVVGTTNNIYFSKYDPIIYTKIVDEHIELTIRYLVDPKKSRIVESMIWNKIFESYNEGKINLYLKG